MDERRRNATELSSGTSKIELNRVTLQRSVETEILKIGQHATAGNGGSHQRNRTGSYGLDLNQLISSFQL